MVWILSHSQVYFYLIVYYFSLFPRLLPFYYPLSLSPYLLTVTLLPLPSQYSPSRFVTFSFLPLPLLPANHVRGSYSYANHCLHIGSSVLVCWQGCVVDSHPSISSTCFCIARHGHVNILVTSVWFMHALVPVVLLCLIYIAFSFSFWSRDNIVCL